MDKDFKPLVVEVVRQGKPVVNADASYIMAAGEDLVAAEIDMHSKYCEVDATCGGELWIGTNENSIHLKDDAAEETTAIRFPEFDPKVWDFFSMGISRYTLRVVLVRRSAIGLD
jgi:hypothetical protein